MAAIPGGLMGGFNGGCPRRWLSGIGVLGGDRPGANARFQPGWLIFSRAAAGCKPMLGFGLRRMSVPFAGRLGKTPHVPQNALDQSLVPERFGSEYE